jgi:DNA-binding MarR family transcriptional regulator
VTPVTSSKQQLIRAVGDEVRSYQRSVDALDELAVTRVGVHRTDGRCVDLLHELGRMPAGELAKASGLSSGATTAAIDRLEAANLARRVRDTDDRRRVLVELTPKARRLAESVYLPLARRGAADLARYTAAELETILDFVRRSRALTDERVAELSR